jgi:hypothetical protein
MNLTYLDNVLWAAGFLGHAALLLILVMRRRWRAFPVFTSFIAFEVLRTALLFLVLRYGTRHGYFLAYWITGFADYVFQVSLIYEIARAILRPTGTWVRDARTAFLGWGMAGLVGSAGFALMIGPPEARGLDLWDVRVTVFTSLLTCELFLAMATAANRLGLQWRSYVVAIGQGIALWAFFSLMEEFGHVALGWDRQFVVLVHVRMVIFILVLVYWMVVFWRKERERNPLSAEMRAYLLALHKTVTYDLESIQGPHR